MFILFLLLCNWLLIPSRPHLQPLHLLLYWRGKKAAEEPLYFSLWKIYLCNTCRVTVFLYIKILATTTFPGINLKLGILSHHCCHHQCVRFCWCTFKYSPFYILDQLESHSCCCICNAGPYAQANCQSWITGGINRHCTFSEFILKCILQLKGNQACAE